MFIKLSYLHNKISYTGKTISLFRMRALHSNKNKCEMYPFIDTFGDILSA